MPTYEITAPDGAIYEIEGEGSEQEALAALQAQLGQQTQNRPSSQQIDDRVAIAHDEAAIRRQKQGELKPYEPTMGDRFYQIADMLGLPAQRMRNKTNAVPAFLDATAQSASFNLSDELEAGARSLVGDESYAEELDQVRGRQDFNREVYPKSSILGDLAGSIGLGAGLTKGGLLMSSRLAPEAGLKAKTLAGMVDGAGLGFLYGAGQGDDLESRTIKGTENAALSAGVGGTIPVVSQGVRSGVRKLKDFAGSKYSSVFNPDKEASRRVSHAIEVDGIEAMDDAAVARNNQPIANVDRGGETTRALARSVANQNPEVRGQFNRLTSDRFANQGTRANDLIDRLMGGSVDDVAYQQNLVRQAQRANRPAYEKAYRYNYGDKFPVEFENIITRIPARAMANAKLIAKAEGRPLGEQLVAKVDEATDTVKFSRMPSIREWDSIQRGLRSVANLAYRSGNSDVATAYKGLHRDLLKTMDQVNPHYQKARQGAASFFGADDALEAGRKYVSMQPKDTRQLRQAISKMSIAEREAFSTGFAAELKGKIASTRDRTNVIQTIFGSQAARNKIWFALGPRGYKEFEAFVKVENSMDLMRNALGNSTTARQLVELGLGGTVGGYTTGDWQGALTGAVIARAMRKGGDIANQSLTRRIADILLSDDPKVLKRGVQMVSRSTAARQQLDKVQHYLQSIIQAPIASTMARTGGE